MEKHFYKCIANRVFRARKDPLSFCDEELINDVPTHHVMLLIRVKMYYTLGL